jgi:MFS family permease
MAVLTTSRCSGKPIGTARRRALVAACVANTVEWYDFAVYGASATVLAAVLLPPASGSEGLVAVFAVFALTLLVRPVGALAVGLRADRVGRRQAFAAMVLPMGALSDRTARNRTRSDVRHSYCGRRGTAPLHAAVLAEHDPGGLIAVFLTGLAAVALVAALTTLNVDVIAGG